jgi:Gram-negative bacterial TonB protein C-terminal
MAVVLSGTAAFAQNAPDVQSALNSALKRKQLPIRDFLGEHIIRYAWAGDHLEHEPEKVFTLGIFQADSIKATEAQGRVDHVTISGRRWTLLKADPAAPGALSKDATPVSFEVNLFGADAATIQGLVPLLFFAGVPSALQAVPVELAGLLPMMTRPPEQTAGGWVRIDGEWKQVEKGPAFTPPKVTFAPEPEFPEAARKSRVSGNVRFAQSVGADGLVAGVWLITPLGPGFDEQAEKAALSYKYQPATLNEAPIGIVMDIEVNFQIF